MPPKQQPKPRGRKRTGPTAAHVSVNPTSSGEESPELDGRHNGDEDFEAFVRSTLCTIVEGQRQLEVKLAASIQFNSEKITELENSKDALHKSLSIVSSEVSSMKNELAKLHNDINKQERFSRRNNFRAVGIQRSANENCAAKVADVLRTRFDWETPTIERAHRDGKDFYGKPTHILVKLLSYQDKVSVMKKCRQALQAQSYFIIDDLTLQDWTEKKKWKDQVKTLYQNGTKLRFFAGRWRHGNGEVFPFKDR